MKDVAEAESLFEFPWISLRDGSREGGREGRRGVEYGTAIIIAAARGREKGVAEQGWNQGPKPSFLACP